MKNFLLFITLCLSSWKPVHACGYSPYGEDVRYSLFSPQYFNYTSYQSFYYNASEFGFPEVKVTAYDANILDWYAFTNKQVAPASIEYFMYVESATSLTPDSENDFVRYLYKNKLQSVIDYLSLAKECEVYTAGYDTDPWERNTEAIKKTRSEYIDRLIRKVDTETNAFLKRRYAFLLIRMAYYDDQTAVIEQYFQRHFTTSKKDFLYYWSLYFYCFTPKATSLDIAEVMTNSPEKRNATYYYFRKKFSLSEALAIAKTNQEKSSAYGYVCMQKLDRSLDYLKQMYFLQSYSEQLDFLLLREINKLEDWIYTPYFTNYLPSIDYVNTWWTESGVSESTHSLRLRSEKDRLYAKELLEFVNTVDLRKVKDPVVWRAAKIQLLYMTKNYKSCIREADLFLKRYPKESSVAQIEQMKVLSLVADQEYGKAVIPKEAHSIIEKNIRESHFIFALGRELEFLGNLPDAAALISNVNSEGTWWEANSVAWQGNRLKKSGNMRYFYDYFSYLDFVYSADELKRIVDHLATVSTHHFDQLIYRELLESKGYLSDLLGTKYIREDRLQDALTAFKTIDKQYWETNYSNWERGRLDYGDYIFDKNPFYDFKYTPVFITEREQFPLTKLTITERLIDHIRKGNDAANPKRAYHYFLVANCYFNMSQYGHSWMMRRFSSTSDYNVGESFVDEDEYRNNHLARKYYQLAYSHATDKKFKALCLRMEAYADTDHYEDERPNYQRLKKEFPEYYEDLSGCYSLNAYFKP